MTQKQFSKKLVESEVFELFSGNKDAMRQLIETCCQEVMEKEIEKHLRAGWHERTSGRKGQRNGYKSGSIKTRVEEINLQCLRLITAVLKEIHEDWISGRRYLKMEEILESQEEDVIDFELPSEMALV